MQHHEQNISWPTPSYYSEENPMTQQLIKKPIASRAFGSVAAAEGTLRRLRSAGIPNDHVTVICPAKFQHQLSTNLAHVETPPEGNGETITKGGVVGATLGGMALATAALAGLGTGGAALVLIGGGAIAGGFSNLIVSKGYQVEADDHITKAVERGCPRQTNLLVRLVSRCNTHTRTATRSRMPARE
jgi:hypothetical protein